MDSKWLIWLISLTLLLVIGCSGPGDTEETKSDPFAASTGGTNYKPSSTPSGQGSESNSVSPSNQGSNSYDGSMPIFLRSEDGKSFVIFEPNPQLKTPFQVKKVSWVNNCKLKTHNFIWSDLSKGDIFWVKYASKLDVKVKLNKPVSSWADLLTAQIVKGPETKKGRRQSILEDDFGKHNNIKMTHDWYFTQASPYMDAGSPCPKP